MSESILVMLNEHGIAEEYDDTWDITIHCESEKEQQDVIEKLNSGWIPVSERLPVSDDFVLISFANATFVMIGRCEEYNDGSRSWHVGDEEESCLDHDLYVNAWMPLPANYEEE